jgi:hypothetical protein
MRNSALPSPHDSATEAADQAYPGDPARAAVYADGDLRGWLDAVAV